MNGRIVGALLVALIPALGSSDTTVRSHEGGVRDGKPWGESYTEYHSSQGLRIDVTTDGAGSPYMSFLFLRNPDRLFIIQGASVTALDGLAVQTMEEKAGGKSTPTRPRVAALGTHHSVNGFACEGFQVRRKGRATRYLCLAPPESLGLPPAFVADARDMRSMLSRFMAAVQRARGKAESSFNPHELREGYPVRLWESPRGDVTWESSLLSVASGPVGSDRFQPPAASK